MDGELRPVVAGSPPARLGPDELPALREIGERGGRNSRLGDLIGEPEFGQLANGMGKEVYADAERLELLDALIDLRRYPDLMQAERQGQATDPRTNNDDGHDRTSLEE